MTSSNENFVIADKVINNKNEIYKYIADSSKKIKNDNKIFKVSPVKNTYFRIMLFRKRNK